MDRTRLRAPVRLPAPCTGVDRPRVLDPDGDAFFTPHAFGVGYGVNLARVARVLRRSR
ncbi:DUF5808 domain-containing protein [Streptomyces sp. NPDC001348]